PHLLLPFLLPATSRLYPLSLHDALPIYARFDRVVVPVELVAHPVEARFSPFLTDVRGKPERGAPVHDGAAADGAAGEDADREIVRGKQLPIPEESGGARILASVEFRFLRERALLEHHHFAS